MVLLIGVETSVILYLCSLYKHLIYVITGKDMFHVYVNKNIQLYFWKYNIK